jgi:hypothetical protein
MSELNNKQAGCVIVLIVGAGITFFVLQWAVIASIFMFAYRMIVG